MTDRIEILQIERGAFGNWRQGQVVATFTCRLVGKGVTLKGCDLVKFDDGKYLAATPFFWRKNDRQGIVIEDRTLLHDMKHAAIAALDALPVDS